MKNFLAALCLTCLPVAAYADGARQPLTDTLTTLQAKSALPGFAVAVIAADGSLYQHGFGLADVAARVPYTEHTVQNIGSVSKTVVGVALMKGVELGYFTLDTDIRTIVPFALGNPGARPITIRQLATHTSGIVDDDQVYGHSYYLTPFADKNSPLLKQFRRDSTAKRTDLSLGGFLRNYLAPGGRYFKKSNFSRSAPGQAYAYTNIGAALAAYLIELKSKQSFDAFTQQHIFQPLGMTETAWKVDARLAERHARVYNHRGQAYPHYALITYPDGGLSTTAADLGRYLAAMMRGQAGQAGVLGKDSFRELFAPQFADGALPAGSPKNEPNSGIFWRIKRDGEVGHTGSDPGITTFLFFDPAAGTGKVLLTNTEFGGADGEDDPDVVAQFLAVWKALDGAGTLAPPMN